MNQKNTTAKFFSLFFITSALLLPFLLAANNVTKLDSLMLEVSENQTVYYGYEPMECAMLNVAAYGGNPPYYYAWETGETTAMIEVCPDEPQYFTVTVTDSDGNVAQDSVRVCVVDVRCGNNMNKVEVCHYPPGNPENSNTLCIGMPAVSAHLAHGDSLGHCDANRSCPDTNMVLGISDPASYSTSDLINIYPNPATDHVFVDLSKIEEPIYSLEIYNSFGQLVYRDIISNIKAIEPKSFNVNHLQSGIYFVKAKGLNKEYNRKILIER